MVMLLTWLVWVAICFQAEEPRMLFVHGMAHCLKLCLQDCARNCCCVRDALDLTTELASLIQSVWHYSRNWMAYLLWWKSSQHSLVWSCHTWCSVQLSNCQEHCKVVISIPRKPLWQQVQQHVSYIGKDWNHHLSISTISLLKRQRISHIHLLYPDETNPSKSRQLCSKPWVPFIRGLLPETVLWSTYLPRWGELQEWDCNSGYHGRVQGLKKERGTERRLLHTHFWGNQTNAREARKAFQWPINPFVTYVASPTSACRFGLGTRQ